MQTEKQASDKQAPAKSDVKNPLIPIPIFAPKLQSRNIQPNPVVQID